VKFLNYWQVGARPALIVGHGRSGTTWVGNVAARARRVLYYFEPAAPNISGTGSLETWFHYIPPGHPDPEFEAIFDPVFRGLPPTGRRWRRAPIHRLIPGYRLVVKEVAALLSTAWLAERYQPNVVVIVRHPCPTILSELRRDVPAEASRSALLARTGLLRDHLEKYREHIERAQTDLEVFAAIWAARYRVIADQLDDFPQWKIVHYEALCDDPIGGFKAIFSHLGLAWDAKVARYVARSSTSNDEGTYSGIRVSRERVDAWKREMTPDRVERVRDVIAPFVLPFYTDPQDWQTYSGRS
jgi:hypothetical protein